MDFIDLERDYIIKAKKENFTIKRKKLNKINRIILWIAIIWLFLLIGNIIFFIINLRNSKASVFEMQIFPYTLKVLFPALLGFVLYNALEMSLKIKNGYLIIKYDLRYIKIKFKDLIDVRLTKAELGKDTKWMFYNTEKEYQKSDTTFVRYIHIEYKRNKSLKMLDIPYESQEESGDHRTIFNQYDVYKLINYFIRKNDNKRGISYLDVNTNDYIVIREDDTELQEVYNSKLNQIKYDVPLKYILLISFVSVLLFCLITFIILKLTIK